VHKEQHFTVVDLIIDKSRRRIKEVKIFCNQRCAINLAQTRVRCPPPPPRSPPPPGNARIPRIWGVVTSAECNYSINKQIKEQPPPASQSTSQTASTPGNLAHPPGLGLPSTAPLPSAARTWPTKHSLQGTRHDASPESTIPSPQSGVLRGERTRVGKAERTRRRRPLDMAISIGGLTCRRGLVLPAHSHCCFVVVSRC